MFNAILVLSFFWGLVLRVWLLQAPIDYDEAYTFLFYIRQTLFTAISQYNLPNNHILNSYIGWVMQHFGTPEPWLLRLVPLVMGSSCLYVVYLGLRSFFSEKVALTASLLSWASYPFVSYSALARGYIFQIFFVFLGLHFLGQKRGVAAAICWALGIWAVPTSLYPLALCLVGLSILKKIDLKYGVIFLFKTGLLTFCLYLPAILYVLIFGTKIFTVQEPWSLSYLVINFKKTYSYLWGPGIWMLFVLPLLGYSLKRNFSAERKFFAVTVGFLVLILILNKSILSYERFWIWLIPFLSAFLIHILDFKFLKESFRSYIFLIFFIPLVFATTQRVSEHNVSPEGNVSVLHQELEGILKPGDFILVSQSTVTLLNYWSAVRNNAGLNDIQPFFISGDWFFSLYRTRAADSILREKIGASRFYALIEREGDLEKAIGLVQAFSGREPKVQSQDLEVFRSGRLVQLYF